MSGLRSIRYELQHDVGKEHLDGLLLGCFVALSLNDKPHSAKVVCPLRSVVFQERVSWGVCGD